MRFFYSLNYLNSQLNKEIYFYRAEKCVFLLAHVKEVETKAPLEYIVTCNKLADPVV